jgi:predicted transcriptional regulator
MTVSDNQIIELTADIVSAHVSNNNIAAADVPGLIQSVYAALAKTSEPLVEEAPRQEPAVSVRASVKPDYIVCLEDGAKLKMLKRYLRTNFDMSPEEYRAKWNLPRDYPMVAPNYAEQRRSLAHQIGLGRKKGDDEADVVSKAPRAARKAAGEAQPAAARKPRASAKTAKAAAQAHLEGTEPEANEA